MDIEGKVYYHLYDPTGISLALVDEQGQVTQVAYDAYGEVLVSTLPADLADTLGGMGIINDPATGLTYLGNGRYYDPILGRPLQPHSTGGIPTVPQSLNRYAATPLGQPGVAEATGGFNWVFDLFGLAQDTTLDVTGERQRIIGYGYSAKVKITVKTNKTAFKQRLAKNYPEVFSELIPTEGKFYQTSATFPVLGLKGDLVITAEMMKKRIQRAFEYKRPPKGFTVNYEVLEETPFPIYGGKFSEFADFKFWKGTGVGLDIAIGGALQYLDDVDNPHLTGGQKLSRVVLSSIGPSVVSYGIGQGLAYAGCVSSIWCGIGASVFTIAVWVITDPAEAVVPQNNRTLRPLN